MKLYTTTQVSEMLDAGTTTVARAARKLKMPKTGSLYIFSEADVEKIKAAIRSGPGNPTGKKKE